MHRGAAAAAARLPIGTAQGHRCPHCARTFVVYDVPGLVFPAFAALVLAGFGALIIAFPPGSAVGAQESNGLFGVALCVAGAIALLLLVRLGARQLHPSLGSR